MSDTIRGGKGDGYEYWSGRPGQWYEIGPSAKRQTAKAERREAKEEIDKALEPPELICGLCDNPTHHEPGDDCYWEDD